MVGASDLKSGDQKWSYEFKSHSGYIGEMAEW